MNSTGNEQSSQQLTPAKTVVLIAEDDAVIRNLVQLMLAKEGYAVLSASDGQEALEILDKFAEPIHLFLTDVRMPRMDGWTLAEIVRKRWPHTKIIVMSGETATTILENNPADAFLRKPFIPPTLLQCIQRVLSSDFYGVCEDVAGRRLQP